MTGSHNWSNSAENSNDENTLVVQDTRVANLYLQEFAARRINLSNLLSRPTKGGGLGDYCFIVYLDGHVSDELVADAMRALHAKQGRVKFLGSYPAAGETGEAIRAEADESRRAADRWLDELRTEIAGS